MPTQNFDGIIARPEESTFNVNITDTGYTFRVGDFDETGNVIAVKYEKGRFGGAPGLRGYLKTSPNEVFYFTYGLDASRKPTVSAGFARKDNPNTSNYVDFPYYPDIRDNRALWALNLAESSENGDAWNQVLDVLSDEKLKELLKDNQIEWDTEELNRARAKKEEPKTETSIDLQEQNEELDDLPFEILPRKTGEPLIIKSGGRVWYLIKQAFGKTMTYEAYVYDPSSEGKYAPAIWHVELPISGDGTTDINQLQPRINLHPLSAPLVLEGNLASTFSMIKDFTNIVRAQQVQLDEAPSVEGDLGVRFNNLAHRGLELMRTGGDVIGLKIDEIFTREGLPGFRSELIKAITTRHHYQS